KLFLKSGADVNAQNDKGESACRIAALMIPHWKLDSPEYAFFHLKQAGCLIDNATAMIIASRTGQADIVRKMVEGRMSPDLKVPDGGSILAYAAAEGKIEVVLALLELGAEINARDFSERTAMLRAAANRCSRVVELLADKGADLTPRPQMLD